jgi:hypothetical protein
VNSVGAHLRFGRCVPATPSVRTCDSVGTHLAPGLNGCSDVANERPSDAAEEPVQGGLTEQEKRDNLIRLVFDGDPARLQQFCDIVQAAIPPDTAVVLRGSSITGRRWNDHAPFDADGPGTSDLDLTLVGSEVISLFTLNGFFVPGVHSRPLSDDDPEIAPTLVPLREALMKMVARPVNIQASRDFVLFLRGDVLGQPYLTLIGKPEPT